MKYLIARRIIQLTILFLYFSANYWGWTSIIKGDLSEPAISAASIIAKVTRDRQMRELDTQYPQYGFAQHKGYGTRKHLLALSKYGPIQGIHRHTFGPIKEFS